MPPDDLATTDAVRIDQNEIERLDVGIKCQKSRASCSVELVGEVMMHAPE
jgi:hypothetical protein